MGSSSPRIGEKIPKMFELQFHLAISFLFSKKIANYEKNPLVACWQKFRGVFQRCVETTLPWVPKTMKN